MKKLLRYLILVKILAFINIVAFSQTTITIGTGTSTQTAPFNCYYGYGRSASIYTTAEVTQFGNITHLAWYVGTSQTTSIPTKIYLKTTSVTTLSSNTWVNLISGATLVYDASRQFNTAGWVTIDITDFNYTADNLMVLCEANYGGGGTGSYPVFQYSASTSKHENFQADTNPPSGNGTVTNNRPNIQITFEDNTPMTYVSGTVTQTNTSTVYNGSSNQEIIGIQVVTNGAAAPLDITSFTLNANGSNDINDINSTNSAKIYYTGTNSTFALTTLFGQNTPAIANYTIAGTQTLASGTNYFWLVYDIKTDATDGNLVDAECVSITVDGTSRTPSTTAPSGSREIVVLTFDGTFESGTTFMANDMTAVNGSQTNYWIVGTATNNGGTNCAYITNNGSANAYSNTSTSVSHFYFDYNFPAGATKITFKFDWKCDGETSYDNLKLFIRDVTFTPSAGTTIGTGQIGASYYSENKTWQTVTLSLDPALAGTSKRIIFSWQNDNSGGQNPPAAVDNIIINTETPLPMEYVSCTTTQNNIIDVFKGTTNQEIISIKIVAMGEGNPLSVSSFLINSVGTDDINDINSANSTKIYYTGSSGTFATTTLFGQNTPTISDFTINGSQQLTQGTNHFWLVYDVKSTATSGNYVDAQCLSVNIESQDYTPDITVPAGNRMIANDYCTSTSTASTSYLNNFSTTGGITNITNNISGFSANGYGNFKNLVVSQIPGGTVDFNTTLVGTTVGVNIWVDWDMNGIFDAAEKVYGSGAYVSIANGSFNVPANAINGNTVMRIRADYNSINPAACGNISRGETEDYTFCVTGYSDIVASGNESNGIQYINFQSNSINTTSDALKVWSFTIRDGGTDFDDADLLPTDISSIKITKGSQNTITNWSNSVRKAALFYGTTKIAETEVTNERIYFSGLTQLIVDDNSFKTFDLYLTFDNYCVDNEQFQFQILNSDITTNLSSSFFKEFSAISNVENDFNRIIVTATNLAFIKQPCNTMVNDAVFPYPKVAAVDINGNIDLDANMQIQITSSGTLLNSPKQYRLNNGEALLMSVIHTVEETDVFLTATYNTWSTNSELFDIIAARNCQIVTSPESVGGELFLCSGNSVDFTCSLSSGTATSYKWDFGDGSSTYLQSISDKTFDEDAGYYTTLTIELEGGGQCKDDLKVMVSGGPAITHVSADVSSCENAVYTLNANADVGSDIEVVGFTGAGTVELTLAETTFLPDIETMSQTYSTTLTYTQFAPDAVLQNIEHLTVYANIEHSFFGDLEIEIECPNSNRIYLATGRNAPSPNFYTFLGEPVDVDATPLLEGVGYEYRWTEVEPEYQRMYDLASSELTYLGGPNFDYQFNAGTYAPHESFTGLLGCPLNGAWTIHISDHLRSDNGFIFEWGLELHESLLPVSWDYQTEIVTYDWTGPGITENPTGPSVVVIPPPSSTYTITVTDNSGCSTSQDLPIAIVECPGMWTGEVSTDWHNPNNWEGLFVPTGDCEIVDILTNVNVFIPDVSVDNGGSGFFPIVTGDRAHCKNLTILPNAHIEIAPDGELTVCGTIYNQNNSEGIIINSDATSTGSILQTSGSVPATVNRYLSGNIWHLTFPTTSAVEVYDYTQGSSYFYSYNETNDDYWNATTNYGTTGWQMHTSGITTANKGYFYFGTSNQTRTLDGGNMKVNDKEFSVTYSPNGHSPSDVQNDIPDVGDLAWENFIGWNLLGNPYSCAIDWNLVSDANTEAIENGIYMWDGAAGNYKYYMNPSGTPYTEIAINQSSAEARYIAPGQAFFVKARYSGNITIPSSARVHNDKQFWKSEDKIQSETFRMTIGKDDLEDETVIWLVDNATDNHDSKYDIYKRFSMNNQFPQIYTSNNTGNLFALNAFEKPIENKQITVAFKVYTAGEYTINFTENYTTGVNIYFEDLNTGDFFNTRNTSSYKFSTTSGLIKDRFILHFNINNSPVIVNQPQNIQVLEDEYFIMKFENIFEEIDLGDDFSLQILKSDGEQLPEWIKVDNLTLSGFPANEHVGEYELMLQATDLCGGITNAYFTLKVINVNDAPFLNGKIPDFEIFTNELFTYQIKGDIFMDLDFNDILTIHLSANAAFLPSWLNFDPYSLILSGKPENEDVGNYDLSLIATDLMGETASSDFTINVLNENYIGINSLQNKGMKILPNPNDGNFVLAFNENPNCDVFIHDVLGRLVYSRKLNNQNTIFDLVDIPIGVYYLSVKFENGEILSKIFIIE